MTTKLPITLFHYLHCPYCIRVRMACGLLGINYKSELLPYADEETPIRLTGKKMAPIIQRHDGSFMNESLDIIQYLDETKTLIPMNFSDDKNFIAINEWLQMVSKPIFNLLMPYYVQSIEFSEKDKIYFQKKKEIKRGPFRELVKNRHIYMQEVHMHLETLYLHLMPYYSSSKIQIYDILLASHLWGLYLATEFRMNDTLHLYLQKVSNECKFSYDWDWWKNN